MRRLLPALFISVVLGLGIATGFGARALMDRWQADPSAGTALGGTPAVPTSAPVAAPPAQAALAPPTAPPTPLSPPAAQLTAVPQDVVVEVTESELEQQLAALIVGQSLGTTPLGEATIQTVSVRLRDSQIHVGGGARAGFLQTPFLAAGTIVPDGSGKPLVKVSQASVGGVDLPESARATLAEALQGRVDELLVERGVTIRTIDIGDGKMRVVGQAGS